MIRQLFFVLVGVLTVACGGLQLDRLAGEPTAADAFTLPVTRRAHPAIDGVQRFIAAMQQNDAERAWQQLSAETRKVLHQRAVVAGVRGVDVLRLRRIPVDDSMANSVAFDPLSVFTVPGVQTLQLATTPAREDAVEQRVNLSGAGGTNRMVVMRFEGYHWRIQHPQVQLPATTQN